MKNQKLGLLKIKYLFLLLLMSGFSALLVYGIYFAFLIGDVPSVESLKNYQPPLISTVVDRQGKKSGEFFKERRFLVPYTAFPAELVHAFVSAEDGRFFEHKGLHLKAIFRAFLANLRAGKKVQGGSTITQQVARALLLSSEKTYKRKIKEAVLALRIEKHFTKEDILYLYLNQIYLGHGAYGVGMASEIYFRKQVKDLTLAESALLAGLPQAPSRFSPIHNPQKAKERQVYTLDRMVQENYIDHTIAQQTMAKPLKVFLREKHHEKAPYYMETLRQSLLQHISEHTLLKGGLLIKSAMDLSLQKAGRDSLKEGLRDLDKRQGWRGPLTKIEKPENIKNFFEKEEKKWIAKKREFRWLPPRPRPVGGESPRPHTAGDTKYTNTSNKEQDNATRPVGGESPRLHPSDGVEYKNTANQQETWIQQGDIIKALVTKVDDKNQQVLLTTMFNSQGLLPLENMNWAREHNLKIRPPLIPLKKPSLALTKGDVVLVKVEKPLTQEDCQKAKNTKNTQQQPCPNFLLSLEQEPLAQGALIALDQKTGDILAMVGGYDFAQSQFNRAYQATRQTGSVFKPLVYLSALNKGWTPATVITDVPLIYSAQEAEQKTKQVNDTKKDPNAPEEESQVWKPDNYGRRFSGDVLFRNGLIQSLNVPTVKIIEDIGIQWVKDHAQRLGIFSPLNPDYTLALGSSSVTLYEMTKALSVIGRLGKKVQALLAYETIDTKQHTILGKLSLDERFKDQITPIEVALQQKKDKNQLPFFFEDPEQLISEQTAFIMTTLLQAVIQDPRGTGRRAKEMDWPLAGKTGTTNGYYDAWFVGFSPQIALGVWVGFDDEKSLGQGETGGRAALPIWLSFMKKAHADSEKAPFAVPEGIVWTHIDNKTGKLVSPESEDIVRQAFRENAELLKTEPKTNEPDEQEDQNFLRGDFS